MLRFLHLPLRLRPGIAFPFKPGRNKGSLSPPALNQALVTTTLPYISVMSHTTCCRMTPLPHVLGAQWAVGGLSARQKGSAAERGREPGILMIFFCGVHHHVCGSAKCAPRPCHLQGATASPISSRHLREKNVMNLVDALKAKTPCFLRARPL